MDKQLRQYRILCDQEHCQNCKWYGRCWWSLQRSLDPHQKSRRRRQGGSIRGIREAWRWKEMLLGIGHKFQPAREQFLSSIPASAIYKRASGRCLWRSFPWIRHCTTRRWIRLRCGRWRRWSNRGPVRYIQKRSVLPQWVIILLIHWNTLWSGRDYRGDSRWWWHNNDLTELLRWDVRRIWRYAVSICHMQWYTIGSYDH